MGSYTYTVPSKFASSSRAEPGPSKRTGFVGKRWRCRPRFFLSFLFNLVFPCPT
ncbi:hypothetical protein BDBG_17603 [Blastomyces gilchristii SLH14081]|uniref:Uncharacterized protein n=1 Tax=Blastomyces gilchristii (strain SLH14081) TaxID=559298 RepID=A0A179UXV6_BLAGS|nr:uncharacterized protein BDBG_17603 [Blastomyces gilchristii SLH14081]OAT11937.1 hypothetical protein BDBG_17603 [Blastomyces gilchristii SLH14081]